MGMNGVGRKMKRFWKQLNNYINHQVRSSSKFSALDNSTPWYNFHLYMESCNSLGFRPSVSSYVRYNAYYKSLFTE